ncbi:MAG: DUF1080 domain-containing protein [Chloroherpetonaceae bacterium]|nr:DUF1080 domain-containing protein [Chthonomonadaceae bacterium]MDW8209328.1 DUF1080 domain-containing protein [Chloroherpetonaceae bacterium]
MFRIAWMVAGIALLGVTAFASGRGIAPDVSREREAPPGTEAETFKPGVWKSLFNGRSLEGWKQTPFSGGGDVQVEPKFRGKGPAIVVRAGLALSGFHWVGRALPRTRYEIALEALKIDGNDFLCGLTFPVGDTYATLVLGGWGGGVVGISSVDGRDASENETTRYMGFTRDRWYRVRLRVTPARIEAWLDDKPIVDLELAGKTIGLRRGEIDRSIPLGISTYQTSAAFRSIRMRVLEHP